MMFGNEMSLLISDLCVIFLIGFYLFSVCVCVCDTGVSPVSSEIFIICGRDDWKVYVQSGVVILL